MPVPGEIKTQFNRQYIYLNPGPDPGTPGGWRIRAGGDEPVNPNPGIDVELTFNAVIADDSADVVIGNLLYLDSSGEARLADALSLSKSQVAGMAVTSGVPGQTVKFVRNAVETIISPASVVEGAPASLTPGATYFLSTTPGKWTTTPNTTSPGVVVRSCGVALDATNMSIEIQVATVV